MGLLDCVSDTSGRRYPVNPPSQTPMQRGMSGRRSLGIFASNTSLKGKDITFWRHRLLGFLFKSEGKEDVGVLKIPLKQMGYTGIGDFIREIPAEIYEPYKSQINPDTGLRKDYKVIWERNGVAEPGMLKWEGTIDGQRCMGLQLDRRKAVPFGVHDGKGLFFCKVGHRALVPVSEVFPYKDFLRQFIGLPPRKDSMPLNLLPGRSSVRVAVTKKYQPGDRVHIPSEGKWATILWTGRIDGQWVVDLVYEPEKLKGRVASPDEPSMNRSLSMAEFIDVIEPRPDSSATPPPHVPPPPPKSPPPKDDRHHSDSEDEVFIQEVVSKEITSSAITTPAGHSESDVTDDSASEEDTELDEYNHHGDSPHSASDDQEIIPSRRALSEPGQVTQAVIHSSPEPIRLEIAKKKPTYKPMFNLSSLGRNKKSNKKQRQPQPKRDEVLHSRESSKSRFPGLFTKSPKKATPKAEKTPTSSSTSFHRQDRSRSPVHRKPERVPSGEHRELPVDVPREMRSPNSPTTPPQSSTKKHEEEVEVRRESLTSVDTSGEEGKAPETKTSEDVVHQRKLSEQSSDTTPPYTPVTKQSGGRTPERRPSKSNAFNFSSFFSSKKRNEPGRIISRTEEHLVQSEQQPNISWPQHADEEQTSPTRAAQPVSLRRTGSMEEAIGDQDFLILDSLEVQDDKSSKYDPVHLPQGIEASPMKREGSRGKGIFSFSKRQKSVPSAESVTSPSVESPPDVPKAKRSSFKQSFNRTFSLTRDKPRDKDRRDSLAGEKNRKYIDNNEALGVKDVPRTKSKSTSALVDIRPWDERRGKKPDIYGSYDSSGDENRSPSPTHSKPIPALVPKQPQPEIPKHRIFTTPVGLFGRGQRRGSDDQPKTKRSSFKGLKFTKTSTSSAPTLPKLDTASKTPESPLKAKPPTSPPPPIPDLPTPSPRTLKSAIKQRKEIDSIPKGVRVGERVVWYNGRLPNTGTVMKLYKDGTDKYTALVKFDRAIQGEPLSLAREGDDYIVTVEELLTPELLGIPVSQPLTSPPPNSKEVEEAPGISDNAEDPKSPTVRFVPSPTPEIKVEPSTPMSPQQQDPADNDGVPPPFQEEEVNVACGVRRGVPGRDVSCCLETILFSMFYTTNAFDTSLLYESGFEQDPVTREIRNILREEIVCPLRQSGFCDWVPVKRLKDLIKTTSQDFPSVSKDVDTTMLVLFKRALKLGKFISYSNDVTDYLHQLVLDPKDLSKSATVQQLFESSLKQMDNSSLRTIPSPALIMEIPRADDKFVRYDAVIPSLSLNVSHILENGPRLCICGVVATFECQTCDQKSKGKALVYCDNCKSMADQVHFQLHHSAALVPFPQSTYFMDLVAVICVKEGRYSAFVKAGNQRSSPWYYYDPTEVGIPKVSLEQHLHMWIDRFERAPGKYHEALVHPLLTHFLTNSQICIYKPREKSSLV